MALSLINTETIPGTSAPDSLRAGAIKINNNFQSIVDDLVEISTEVCNLIADPCLYPKIHIVISRSEISYASIQPGDVLYRDTSYYSKAIATLSDKQEAIGVVYSVNRDDVHVCLEGYICNLQGLSVGKQYYLSPYTAGQLIRFPELFPCDIIKPICTAISSTEAIVQIKRSTFMVSREPDVYKIPDSIS